jgi:Amt family ammonium transporter
MPKVDTGDTAWLLAAAALVMFMTPGLALFYGGLVRAKNVLATVMQSFVALAVVSVLWMLVGYTLAFGPDVGRVVGDLEFLGLSGVGAEPSPLAPTVPAQAFMTFQLMFAVITPALITGAFAERVRFSGYLLFLALWSILVYAPVAHWVWGGGFLGPAGVGALDFAGGTVVHVNAGAAALAMALYLGKRRGYGQEAFVPHNVPLVVLGASILWFGWFGFNAGSALASGGLAASAFTVTHLGAASATLGWLLPEWVRHGRPTTVGAATGAVAGLVAITPASGFVGPWGGLAIGFAAGVLCFLAVEAKSRLGYDDSLDVVGVHLVGGVVGAVLTGAFASLAVNPAGAEASLGQVGRQAAAVAVTAGYSFLVTLLVAKACDLLLGLRVSEDEEVAGLDLSQHREVAYHFGAGVLAAAHLSPGGAAEAGAATTTTAPGSPETAARHRTPEAAPEPPEVAERPGALEPTGAPRA